MEGMNMAAQVSRFNRFLLILMIALYVISLAAFTYANWRVEPVHSFWNMLVNGLILSLPLVLFYGAIYVLASAWREHRQAGQISARLAKIIHWAPRIAAIVIIFFVGLFSLDVFGEGGTLLEQLGAFLMHSLPSIVMIIMLVFAWRRPVVGFVAFLLAGLGFLRFVIGGPNLGLFLLFSGPMLLICALFYADWRWRQPNAQAATHAS
jgi:hypothetical protein